MICPVVMLNCELGLYKIHWKSGGASFAYISQDRNGNLWFAATNWTSGNALLKDHVQSIARMEMLHDHKDRNKEYRS